MHSLCICKQVFPGMWQHCCAVTGASLQAASLLLNGKADVAINWGGGRHHAMKVSAIESCS
jgi:acetoin utilization deacetylase AcuC-like enzyme